MKIFLAIVFALALVGAVMMFIQNSKPAIELGLEGGKLREVPTKPNSVSTMTVQVDKVLEPLAFVGTKEESVLKLKQALLDQGNIIIIGEEHNYIYAIATTKIGFRDDIEILIDEELGLIHYRSASRAGYSDMGLNRKRYEMISESYKGQN